MSELIMEIIKRGGYLGIFFLMALENVFPPVPSELIMGIAGILVARGDLHFVPLLLIGTSGTLAGNLAWYWLGRRWSESQLRAAIDRHGRWFIFGWDDFLKARKAFRRNGDWIVFLLRFSPVLRTMVSLPAGLAKMKFWRFCLFTFAGSLLWNGALILGGRSLAGLIERYEVIASWIIGAGIAAGIGWYVYRVIVWKPAPVDDRQD